MSLRLVLNGGEVSPSMYGRCDVDVYQRSAELCRNMIVNIEGGVHRRSGLELIAGCEEEARVFGFRYDGDENFVLLLNDWGFRVFSVGEQAGIVYEFRGAVVWTRKLNGVTVMQVNDVVWVCGDFMPQKILRKGLKWELEEMAFDPPPWEDDSKNKGILKYNLLSSTDPLVCLTSENDIFSREMAYGNEMIRLKLSRLDASYALWSSLIWRIAILPGNAFLNSRGNISVLSSAIIRAGEQFTQYQTTSYYLFTCLKDFHGYMDAALGEDARNYPEFFMPGINAGKDYRGRISEAWSVLPFDSTKRTTFYAGSTVKIEGLSDGLAYYSCIKDFKYWLKKDGGDVDPQWTKPRDISSRYIDFLTHINYHYFPLFPFEVCGGWELTTEGVWNADWEIRRSYDKFSVHKKISDYHWDTVKVFSQTPATEGKNYAISGMEKEPCLLGIFCTRTSELGLGGIGKSTFKTLECRVDLNVKIEEYISPKKVNGRIENWGIYYDAIGSSTEWAFGAFGSKNGYPRAMALHQGRLWFGGSRGNPTGLWGSVVDDYVNFRVGDNDDDALSVSLAGRDQCGVMWLSSQRHLLVGTKGAEWVIAGGQEGVVKPSTVSARVQSRMGSHGVCTVSDSMSGVIYVAAGGRRVNELGYSWEAESYMPRDISLYSSHILGDAGAKRVVLQRVPDVRAWVVRGDGKVACCSSSTGENIYAWSLHEFAAGGVALDACVSIGDKGQESVWFVVRRSGGDCALCRLGENTHYVDYWRCLAAGEYDVSGASVYLSEYVSTRLEYPQSASRKDGAVKLQLDIESSRTHFVEVSLDGLVWRAMPMCVGLADGWTESGVSGTYAKGLKLAVRVSGDQAFSLRGGRIG